MILPSKHLPESRSLIAIGGEVLAQLDEPRTVSELWERVRLARCKAGIEVPLSFDWFVLAITFLHTILAVDLERGLVARTALAS
jgi:hypothetical protein